MMKQTAKLFSRPVFYSSVGCFMVEVGHRATTSTCSFGAETTSLRFARVENKTKRKRGPSLSRKELWEGISTPLALAFSSVRRLGHAPGCDCVWPFHRLLCCPGRAMAGSCMLSGRRICAARAAQSLPWSRPPPPSVSGDGNPCERVSNKAN